MSARFSAVWKDAGLLAATPPFLVVPQGGFNLVYLFHWPPSRSLNLEFLKFDRAHMRVTPVRGDTTERLVAYSGNFPPKVFPEVIAIRGEMQNWMKHAVLLSIEGRTPHAIMPLEYRNKADWARLDVYAVMRHTVGISFRFVRYQNAAGDMKAGTARVPSDAQGWVDVLNRLYMPSANFEFDLQSSEFANVGRKLGESITRATFLTNIAPLRDGNADVTVFFVGKYKGTDDPLGEAFADIGCAVVDDNPWQPLAPRTTWPPSAQVTDEELAYYMTGNKADELKRPKSDRDLFVVLAHEVGHCLGARHNDDPDNIMSNGRQDLKLSRTTVFDIANAG